MKPDIVDIRLDRLRADLDSVRKDLAVVSELLTRLIVQVNDHGAVLARMCHGPLSELPADGQFTLNLAGAQWYIVSCHPSTPDRALYWLAWKGPYAREETGQRNGHTATLAAAMDAIRKAHVELGVTP